MIKIGIQGAKEVFQGCVTNLTNHGIDKFEIIYQISSETVLSSLETNNTDYGIIAMECKRYSY